MTAAIPMTALDEGEMTLCRVDGRELLICHVEGHYYALDSRCSHAGQALITGRLEGFKLYCPLHRASFDVRTGQALTAPAVEPIATYPVMLETGKVHIEIS